MSCEYDVPKNSGLVCENEVAQRGLHLVWSSASLLLNYNDSYDYDISNKEQK